MKSNYPIVLGSQSPRRQSLLQDLGVEFTIRTSDEEEVFPDWLYREEIVEFLAKQKAEFIGSEDGEVLITSDTIVWVDQKVVGKPKSRKDSIEMIQNLSGRSHEVLTGVCVKMDGVFHLFHDITKVVFKELSDAEIIHYVDTYKPFDKAGSYGIQEWIGYIGIQKIEGDFFNVMGFPLFKIYEKLIDLKVIEIG